MQAAGSGQPQTALGSSAQPSLDPTTGRAHAQHGHSPVVSRQADQTPPQSAPNASSGPVLHQPSSRLRNEAGPVPCSIGVDAVQSGDAPAELLAALQNPQPASRSSWSLWAAQLRAAPSPAPPQPGTLGHTGQPETVQGPANQSAHGQGYRQLPLVSSIRPSAAPRSASASEQRPEQAGASHRQGVMGQMHHASEQRRSMGQRMQPPPQPFAAVATPDLAPQYTRHGAFSGAASAGHPSATAHQSSISNGQRTASPGMCPAPVAGNLP